MCLKYVGVWIPRRLSGAGRPFVPGILYRSEEFETTSDTVLEVQSEADGLLIVHIVY